MQGASRLVGEGVGERVQRTQQTDGRILRRHPLGVIYPVIPPGQAGVHS